MLAFLLQGITLGFSAAVSPGPFQAYLIGQSLRQGWRRTLPASLAPLITDGPIIALMLLLLTSLPDTFLRAIRILGGGFVIYLAWKAFQTWRTFWSNPIVPQEAGQRTLLQAIAMNFLSPGPYLFWSLLAGPALIRGWNERPAHGLAFILGFYATLVGGLVATIVLFSAARQLGPKVNRALIGVSALALFGFGVYQLVQGIA
jgi:threonine/homoserine/homoserine lactone efflux protein